MLKLLKAFKNVAEALSDTTPQLKKLLRREKSIDEDTPIREPIEGTLYDHRIITVEEELVNRMLRNRYRDHWLIHSITFEFEPNNVIFMSVITKLGNVINASFTLEDLWFDDYASVFEIKLDMPSLDVGSFILNSIVHVIGKWTLNLLGIFFNPFEISDAGSGVRFEKNGIIRFDLVSDSDIRRFIPLPERLEGSMGPLLLANAKTTQAAIRMDYYAFHEPVQTFNVPEVPMKTSWVRSIDIAAALLLPIGVWISFIILHHYLPTETIEFSFSTYFLISIGILCISFLVMNIPRYIYMYFDSRKHWQSVFVHNNIKIQMRKLHRRIITLESCLESDNDELDASYQEKIRYLILQIRDKRFLAQRLKIADEDRDRKQKVKFIIAYIGCTLLEWMLLID